MYTNVFLLWGRVIVLASLLLCQQSYASLVDIIQKSTPSVVAIGMYTPLEQNGNRVLGTGFVVANGRYAITNYHVVSEPLDPQIVQHYVVIEGKGREVKAHRATIIKIDPVHDLALLSFEHSLPALPLAPESILPPGTDIIFTGFPIGAAIGLYPATHKGMISAITPDAIPAQNADQLSVAMLKRLQQPELVYQIDATAYPGNSGSPVFDTDKGQVVAVITKVFVSQGKESALSAPSGISYAIPVIHVHTLLKQAGL